MTIRSTKSSGFSFVEMLVTAALVALVFGGLFGSINSMIKLISNSKAKAGATALAVEQIEYIRSLPYDSIGTVSGVPAGALLQNSTTSLNGLVYSKRILVEYVDDPADGFGVADSNGILADYKRVKVEISWQNNVSSSSIALVTSIMPVGIESTAGGGTIRVNVFDALALPVSNAAVRFYNDSTTSTIDTTRYTNAEGIAYLAGAPAAANYQITATKSGYSTDGTTQATTSNPNPTTQPIAVAVSAISTMDFQIDLLSGLTIETKGEPTTGEFTDTFDDDTLVASYASTTRSGSEVELEGGAGSYAASGSVLSATTSPSILSSWEALSFNSSTTSSTSVRVSVYYESAGVLALVPDLDLPGNSFGYSGGPVDLSTLDTSTYDTLALQAILTTLDPNETPTLYDWTLSYIENQAAIANVDFTLHGAKVIGTDVSASPIYKFDLDATTNGSGIYSLPSIEWDVYSFILTDGAYQVLEVCPLSPNSIAPSTAETMEVILHSYVSPFLRVTVVDTLGGYIANATVELDKVAGSYNEVQDASLCGQTAFYGGGLTTDADYTVTASAPGFIDTIVTDVTVNSTSTITVVLN